MSNQPQHFKKIFCVCTASNFIHSKQKSLINVVVSTTQYVCNLIIYVKVRVIYILRRDAVNISLTFCIGKIKVYTLKFLKTRGFDVSCFVNENILYGQCIHFKQGNSRKRNSFEMKCKPYFFSVAF